MGIIVIEGAILCKRIFSFCQNRLNLYSEPMVFVSKLFKFYYLFKLYRLDSGQSSKAEWSESILKANINVRYFDVYVDKRFLTFSYLFIKEIF